MNNENEKGLLKTAVLPILVVTIALSLLILTSAIGIIKYYTAVPMSSQTHSSAGSFLINSAMAQVDNSQGTIFNNSPFRNYTESDFSVSYPSLWIEQPVATQCCGSGEAFYAYAQNFTCGSGGCNNNSPPEFDVETQIAQGTLQSYVDDRIGNLKSDPNVISLNDYDSSLHGMPDHEIVYADNQGIGQVDHHEIILIDNGTMYTLAYSALPSEWSTYEPGAYEILDTFQPTPSSQISSQGCDTIHPTLAGPVFNLC